jgi:hypothetical protein
VGDVKVEIAITIEVPEEGVVFNVGEFLEKRVPLLQERIHEVIKQQIPSKGTVRVEIGHRNRRCTDPNCRDFNHPWCD